MRLVIYHTNSKEHMCSWPATKGCKPRAHHQRLQATSTPPKDASHKHTTEDCKPRAHHQRSQATSTPPKVASHKHTTEDCKPRARHQRLQATSTPPQAHHRRLMKATSTPPNSIYLEHPHAKAPSLQKHVHPETLAVLFV